MKPGNTGSGKVIDKGVSNIIGEVILVAFTLAVSLGYVAYMNSTLEYMRSSTPPPIVAEAQENSLYVLWFNSTNTSIELTLGEIFNKPVKTIITVLGLDKYGKYKPLHISDAKAFTGINSGSKDLLVAGGNAKLVTVEPSSFKVIRGNNYYSLNDLGVTSTIEAVELNPDNPILYINATLENSLDTILIVAATPRDNIWFEYSVIEANIQG